MILYFIIFITFRLVTAKNSMVCMLLFVTMCLIGQLYDSFLQNERLNRVFTGIQKYFLDYTFIIAYALFKLLVAMKEYIRRLLPEYPFLWSYMIRLDTAEKTADMPFTLFGRHISESGSQDNYFVVDSFMARTPAMSGMVIFLVYMLIFTYFMIRARRLKARAVYIAFMVMALYAITDPSFVEPELNFLIVLPFACWDVYLTGGCKADYDKCRGVRSMKREWIRYSICAIAVLLLSLPGSHFIKTFREDLYQGKIDKAGVPELLYRTHVQDRDWMGWAKNGGAAGTAGYARRLEGIQIVIVNKGASAPGAGYGGINQNDGRAYIWR